MATMPASQIVTPVNSQEDSPLSAHNDWLSRLLKGVEISPADWEQLGQEKNALPVLNHSSLNKNNIESGQLVRMRGMMVQDMLETEYYATASVDRENSSPVSHLQQLGERTPILMVPIPYTSDWFRSAIQDGVVDTVGHRGKRARLNDDVQEEAANMETTVANDWWNADSMQSDPEQVPVLAEFYYDLYGINQNRLRLNELVECIGVLEKVDSDEVNCGDQDFMSSWDSPSVPHSIPRVHVLWYERMGLDRAVSADSASSLSSMDPSIHTAATALASALSVPATTAAALWMTLLSTAEREALQETASTTWAPIYTPQGHTLGCASLNVVVPNGALDGLQNRLHQVLSQILPVVYSVSLTHETLRDLKIPRKEQGRLVPSPLQLPQGSTLILNIGSMQAGRLSADQLEALQALQRLTVGHRIPYLFDGGVKIPFEADVRVIVLSTVSSKKILPCTLQVKCHACNGNVEPNLSNLTAIRNTLASVRGGAGSTPHHNNIYLSEAVLQQAQQDFVERRTASRQQMGQATVDERDFHRWLTLTRLQARSRRSKTAQVEDWREALALDDRMIETLNN